MKKLYHISPLKNRNSIITNGLKLNAGERSKRFGQLEERIYLTDKLWKLLKLTSLFYKYIINMKLKKYNEYNSHKETLIVSAFPGCGKSHYFRENKDKIVLDSDSSKFDKSDFPRNYIQHIKENIGKVDIIMVSSHKEVRDALVENGIEFTLVYPDKSIKDEYIQRYIDRGSPDSFINLLTKNWELWIDELDNQIGCDKIKLKEGEYLSDVL